MLQATLIINAYRNEDTMFFINIYQKNLEVNKNIY